MVSARTRVLPRTVTMIRITRPSVTRSCTSGIPWNNTGCPRLRKEELGLRCPWFELEKEKEKRRKKERERKKKKIEFSFEYTTFEVGFFSTCSTTSDTRYVHQAIPPDDASGIRDIVPSDDNGGMGTEGDEGDIGLKKKGARFVYRSLDITLRKYYFPP